MYKLRELERADMSTINKWRNDPELIASLGAPFRFINSDVDNGWYENYLRSRGGAVRCAIVDDANESKILGLISLTSVDNVNRSAEMHMMIGQAQNRGKGLGFFAVESILKHGFMDMNLNRIEMGVLETNIPAQRLYEKAGFVREGVKRSSNFKNGRYVSTIIMGLLRDEYLQGEH